ncbi:MAG TPA: hypothetical protein VGC77_01330 [Rhodopseudomonas sp.]|uniref:hypothetical protein n=1 Tax=Rhodopseudomonas sp. TaxID=1078 RepID=UPI002ED90F49
MPALFAYLVTLALLIGGGASGLYVLSHPDVSTAQARSSSAAKKTAEPRGAQLARAAAAPAPTDVATAAPGDSAASAAASMTNAPSPQIAEDSAAAFPAPNDTAIAARPDAAAPQTVASVAADSKAADSKADDVQAALPAPAPSAQNAAQGNAKPAKTAASRRKAKLAREPGRPVLMTLRVIEYADGHREEQLIPLTRSRRAVSRADDWADPFD